MIRIQINGKFEIINDRAFDKLNNLLANEDDDVCNEYSPICHYWCTRKKGHTGVHVAHGSWVVAVWGDENEK